MIQVTQEYVAWILHLATPNGSAQGALQTQEEIAMNKFLILIFAVSAFSWISLVSAGNWPVKESPESTVTCVTSDGVFIADQSVLKTVNVEQCTRYSEDQCAPCIASLEDQGCKFVDVIVTHAKHEIPTGDVVMVAAETYLLSCDGR